MEKNNLYKLRVTRFEDIIDELNNKTTFVYGTVENRLAGMPSTTEFRIVPLSLISTLPVGTKTESLPVINQLLLGYIDPINNICYSIGYISETNNSMPLSEVGIEPGDFRFKSMGLDPTFFNFAQGKIDLIAGMSTEFRLNNKSGRSFLKANTIKNKFSGGREDYVVIPADNPLDPLAKAKTPTTMMYTQTNESVPNSDLLYDTEEANSTALVTSDYVDKTIIRAGAVSDKSHVYQLDTIQSKAKTHDKDTVTSLKLGHQDGLTNDYAGSLIDWSFKTKGISFFDTMNYNMGNLDNSGEFLRQQIMHGLKTLVSVPIFDPLSNGNGHNLYSMKDDLSLQADLWYINSVADGVGSKWYKKEVIGKSNTVYDSNEVSDTNLFKHENKTLPEVAGQVFHETLHDDEYEINLKTQTTEYQIKMQGNKINIRMNTGDKTNSPSVEMSDSGIKISPGTGKASKSIILTSDGVSHQLVTKEWVENIFKNHMHPTAAQGAPSKPIRMPILSTPGQTSHTTFITEVQ